ncbi:MAG: cyclic nucleotide-binding domain-containing protein [Pseudomonadota bacterium]|nr:cyclic nucleotide-binding domain-containing protein [Pseudomonadota bacterium]
MTTAVTRERMITFLLETPMFDNLDPPEIMQVIHIVEVQLFKAGDIIFSEGDPGDSWYVLYKGKAEVLKSSGADEKLISVLGPGSCFGEIAILDGLPRSATIRASEDSVVFHVPRSTFGGLLDNDDLVAHKLIYHMATLLAQRQRSTTERLSRLLVKNEVNEVHEGIKQIVGESSVRE